MPQDRHLTGSWRQQALEDFNGRSLPRPVRTEQAEALASFDLEVQPANGLYFAFVGLAQIAALDGWGHGLILSDIIHAVVMGKVRG